MREHRGIVNWGISSTGSIASQFAKAFRNLNGGRHKRLR